MSQTKLESQATPAPKKTGLSIMQSIIAGSIAGAGEVFFDHPLWTIKTRMQKGDPFTMNPQILYRGIIPNAASMIPITALQVALNCFFQQCFLRNKNELTSTERLNTAFAAGVGSAFVSCPTEMIMTHQKTSFYSAGMGLVKQAGLSSLYRGLPITMLREGMFTTFFLGVTPIMKSNIGTYCSNDLAASIFAGILAGIGATLASQGADTVKTIQQSAPTSIGLDKTIRDLYSSGGVKGFFSGTIPRGMRVVSAVTIMGLINEKMNDVFADSEEQETSSVRPG